jgi:creatinine amidohydrolase
VFITTATSRDEAERAARVAVLPVGSFEQHDGHLPLSTDTLIAAAIARRVAADYNLFLLPSVTMSCSHEHAAFAGTVSISSATLATIVRDVADSLAASGVHHLAIISGHGGNYVLSNIVQEANVGRRSMLLFPRSEDWRDAREAAGVITSNHDDMHGGEAETSILLAEVPELVGEGSGAADHVADDRRHLLTTGIGLFRKWSAGEGVIDRAGGVVSLR